MTTKLRKQAISTVRAWCLSVGIGELAAVRHVHPRAYVVAQPAPMCIVVVEPWQDAEKHMREDQEIYPARMIERFETGLTVGSWCCTAYVMTPAGRGLCVAVKIGAEE